MALMVCIECQKEMSDTLEACPHCGFKRLTYQEYIPDQKTNKPISENTDNNTICIICDKPYYKGASKCPYCKAKNVNKKRSGGLRITIVAIVVLIAIAILNEDKDLSTSNSKPDLQPSTLNNTNSNRKIRFTVGGYAAAPTEELLDKVTELSISKDYNALQQLMDSGLIIQLKDGVKVEVVKMKFTVVKFRIFGSNKEYWAVVEALKN